MCLAVLSFITIRLNPKLISSKSLSIDINYFMNLSVISISTDCLFYDIKLSSTTDLNKSFILLKCAICRQMRDMKRGESETFH